MLVLSLCLHLSFLSLYLLIVAVVVINFGLECFINLDIAYVSYFAHILFDYKLVLVFCNWGSKHSLVFYTLIELSKLNKWICEKKKVNGIYFYKVHDEVKEGQSN